MSSVANGFLFDDAGILQTSAGPIASWNCGLPFDDAGNLVVTFDEPVMSDAYVGSTRVSPTKGVYVIGGTPPVEFGFSNGFSGGFDVA